MNVLKKQFAFYLLGWLHRRQTSEAELEAESRVGAQVKDELAAPWSNSTSSAVNLKFSVHRPNMSGSSRVSE